MINNRQIHVATSPTRFGPWTNTTTSLQDFYTLLSIPKRSTELRVAYMALPKKKQDDLKDVGGFVGGALSGTRKAGAVTGRDLVTLDIDKVIADGTEDILKRLHALGVGFICYSTRKHGPEAPRLRAIIPLDRTVSAEEYEPIARMTARYIDPTMQIFDRTTFQPERLMYYPSCSLDGIYVYEWADKPFLYADAVLQQLGNWQDVGRWPRCPDEDTQLHARAAKQEDPTTKKGIIGAFCRTYDILTAMEHFLPGAYEPTANDANRYTFLGGTTSGGAVIYNDGLFLYSHHSTDPCCGELVNAFDLVRRHKFGELDGDAKPNTPTTKMPSYMAFCDFLQSDPAIRAQLQADTDARILEDFAGLIQPEQMQQQAAGPQNMPQTAPEPQGAVRDIKPINPVADIKFELELTTEGLPKKTLHNAWTLLETDPMLRGKIVLDAFAGRGVAHGPYPWDLNPDRRLWTDADDAGVQWYLEHYRGFRSKADIMSALTLCGNRHSIDPVRTFLDSVVWDGIPRLDRIFIDYLGAEDNEYIRAVSRKAFVAAVARTYDPGCKFDCMTILAGPQGAGKSTLLQRMGKEWFNDNLQTFEGKEAKELIQGGWIVEIGELGYMNKTETNQVKQFLSQREDTYRAAYGRNVQSKPRRCVFFGTTNEDEYLKDMTGNRRFWPVDIDKQEPTKDVFNIDEEIINLLWAEAVWYYRQGEQLFLSRKLEKMAQQAQEEHRQVDSREGLILEYLEQEIPAEYEQWTPEQRMAWDNGMLKMSPDFPVTMQPRAQVCAVEIYEKALGGNLKFMKMTDSRFINGVVKKASGWNPETKWIRTAEHGNQRGFKREGYQ